MTARSSRDILASEDAAIEAARLLRSHRVYVGSKVTQVGAAPPRVTGFDVRFAQVGELARFAAAQGWRIESLGARAARLFLEPGRYVRLEASQITARDMLPLAAQALLDVRADVHAGRFEQVESWAHALEASSRMDAASAGLSALRLAVAMRIDKALSGASFGVLPAVSAVAGTLAVLLESRESAGYVTPMAAATTCVLSLEFVEAARSFHDDPDSESRAPRPVTMPAPVARPGLERSL